MPVQFRQQNSGLGELARSLVSAPGLMRQGRLEGEQLALQRANDAASMQKSLADARKSQLEGDMLSDQRRFQAGLPQDLATINAAQTGQSLRLPPPAVGSAGSKLEFDVNESIRSNPDLFESRAVPDAVAAQESLANLLRGFGGNAAQITDAMGNVQNQGFQQEAAGVARDDLTGSGLMAALSNIASGSSMTPFETNASGTVLDRFTGGLDESGQLAGANIDAERALADQRRTTQQSESLTPQDKQFDALVKLNEALVESGAQPIDEVTMRQIAAGTFETFRDPLGLRTMVFDNARRQVVGTIDEKNGFVPFEAPEPEAPPGPGMFDRAQNFLFGGDEGTVQATPEPSRDAPQAAGPGTGEGFFSPVLGRNVTQEEIDSTAQNRGLTPDQVKQQLGIQ